MSQEAAEHKDALRASIRARRRQRSEAERQEAADAIAARVLRDLQGVSRVACTISTPTEPGTAPLITALQERGVTVIVPQARPDGLLLWTAIDQSTTWHTGAHGIAEPSGDGGALDAECVIVPALAVAPDGTRLGQGGGYFDRALAQSSARTIATVFDDELLDDVPADAHDVRVQVIVTPSRTLHVG